MISKVMAKLTFIWQASARVKAEHGISRIRQFSNLFILLVCRQMGPRLYYENAFWENKWPISRQLGFMHQNEYKKHVEKLNPKAYQKFSQHKFAEKALLQLLAIPTPRYAGFYHVTKGCTAKGAPLCAPADLLNLLKENEGTTLCFKPSEGFGGEGFVAVQGTDLDGKLLLKSPNPQGDSSISVESFIATCLQLPDGYLIEEYLQQHPDLAALNPSSVNTLRIWVRQCGDNTAILGVLLRIGRRGSLVDSSRQGGLVAYLDQSSGIITKVRSTAVFPEYYDCHPDTGARLQGQQIPYWQESLALAGRTIRSFPGATFAGMDVAIGLDGPQVIELNLEPDKISARIFEKSHRELLG